MKERGAWSNQWNSSVNTTNSDPRQNGDGRSEVVPSWDEVTAWLEVG